MTVIDAEKWLRYLDVLSEDRRLNVWHLALLTALVRLAYLQKGRGTIRISRSILMELSHIHTLPTFHKYFKELQDMGFIKYTPSYHPGVRSTVEFLIP